MDKPDVACIIRLWRSQRENLNKSLAVKVYPEDISQLCFTSSSALSKQEALSPAHQLEALCESLMDYICSGHFNIYRKLLQQNLSLPGDTAELVKGIYYNIETSTDQALNFHDKYNCTEHCRVAEEKSFAYDLDKLNRALAIRFVLEEQLIEIACN